MEIVYSDYKGVINKIAYHFYSLFGLELNELIGEANVCFCYCLKNYNTKKGKFSTYLWKSLFNWLGNFSIDEVKQKSVTNNFNENMYEDCFFDKDREEKIRNKQYILYSKYIIDRFEYRDDKNIFITCINEIKISTRGEISKEAKIVLDILARLPDDFIIFVSNKGNKLKGSGKTLKNRLQNKKYLEKYLRSKYKWKSDLIAKTFREIKALI